MLHMRSLSCGGSRSLASLLLLPGVLFSTLLCMPGLMFGWEAVAADCGGTVYERVVKYWDKIFGGSAVDSLSSMIPTADGGYLLGGYSNSGATGDKSEASRGEDDYWVVKIDSGGGKVWDRRFGGSSYDDLCTVIATPDGGYLLGGSSASGADGDKSEASRGSHDYWVVKIDGTGTKDWDKRFGGSGYDEMSSLIAIPGGGYLLGGSSYSEADGDKSEAARGQSMDYGVVKIDGAGTKVWDRRFGGSSDDHLFALIPTQDGGYLLGGSSYSVADGDKSETSRGQDDYWVVKIDSGGGKIWDRRFGGTSYDDLIALIPTPDGGCLLGGYSYSGAGGDRSEASRGQDDYWVVKIDGSGGKVWDKRFGGSSSDDLGALIPTPDGGSLLGGYSDSGAEGDKGEASRGVFDYWVVKIDGGGVRLWDKRFGGLYYDAVHSLIPTPEGGYLLGGLSFSGAGGDKSQASRGGGDYWVIHMDIDRDCDGRMDGAEALAGTDPTNDASYLAVSDISQASGLVNLRWHGGQSATQIVERTTSLINPAWVPAFTNIPPTEINNLLQVGETNPASVYRIRVQR